MITQSEFTALLADRTKRIEGELAWSQSDGHWPASSFRVPVRSEPGWPLFVEAWWNPRSEKLSYTLIHRGYGRILGLDLGSEHRNPSGDLLHGVHKHQWTSRFKDRDAYAPPDITAPWHRPVEVWRQFCAEATITHRGVMHPPVWQEEMPL